MDKQSKPSLVKQALRSTLAASRPAAQNISAAPVVASMLGLAGPLLIGAAAGLPQSGVVASLGALIIGGQGREGSLKDTITAWTYALIAGGAAMFIGTVVSGNGFAGWAIVALCAVAGFFGGASRPLARATAQFMILLIIAGNMPPPQAHPLGMTLLFALGALWAAALFSGLPMLFRAARLFPVVDASATDLPRPSYTFQQVFRYWRNNLRHRRGWQYPLRITLCLAAAEIIRELWPQDHSYWISLTVAIVVHRDLQSALTRTVQRTLGTFLGVLLVSLFLLGMPPSWAILCLIALLSGIRLILAEINYAASVAAVTPLIILLLDFGRPPAADLMAHRLMATLAGCLISLILGYLLWINPTGRSRMESEESK